MLKLPTVSIVVTTRFGGECLEKCLKSLKAQSYPSDKYEIIVVSDAIFSEQLKALCEKYNARLLQVDGKPGAKRNLGVKESKGEIVAFCDDDVIVDKNWIKALLQGFVDQKVAVVGGPNLTPLDARLRERCSGYIFASRLGSAAMAARYMPNGLSPRSATETDLISCNMAVKKSIFNKIGGFPEDIWPNEENIFFHLVKKAGYELVYTPNAIVWHNRRPIFIQHMKQNFRYGKGRGQMTRRHPDSVKLIHLMPSLFVLYLIAGILLTLTINGLISSLYILTLLAYFIALFVESLRIAIKNSDYKALPLLPVAFFVHHCSYGIGFLIGLVSGHEK